MLTLKKIIYDIKNIIYGGTTPDDADISDRQIEFWINEIRALLIRQELSNRLDIPSTYIQEIVVDLERIDSAEDCDVQLGCYLLRSVNKIPATIRRGMKNTITSVLSLDGSYGYSETTFFRKRFNAYNKYTKKKERYYIKNNYLYITNSKVVEKVRLSGVFEEPRDLSNFRTCTDEVCYSLNMEYPVSLDMASTITDIIIKTKASVIVPGLRADNTNDSRDAKA